MCLGRGSSQTHSGKNSILNRCQSEIWMGNSVFVQILTLTFFSPLVSLTAYSLQLGRRLQLTVSGSYQCRGSWHPGESTIYNRFSFEIWQWKLGLDKRRSPVLIEMLTWGTDWMNHGASMQWVPLQSGMRMTAVLLQNNLQDVAQWKRATRRPCLQYSALCARNDRNMCIFAYVFKKKQWQNKPKANKMVSFCGEGTGQRG